jgi:tetratricopeptide (TPR) repeat protein
MSRRRRFNDGGAFHPRSETVMFGLSMSERRLLGTFLLAAGMQATIAFADPYHPISDSEILERLPGRPFGPSPERERALRDLVAREPGQLDLAVRLAGIEVERSRTTSDPRPLGQAEALLSPWWNEDSPAVPVLILRATIRQRSHLFAPARRDLEQAVRREPNNAQAWLILASIEQVTGNYDKAAQACAHLQSIATPGISVSCDAALEGVRGHAAEAYTQLSAVMRMPASRGETGLHDWMLTLQAELAERLNRRDEAERLYRQSLAASPSDTYTIAAYADFLLDADRAGEIPALIAVDTPVDTLLLRRAQAAHRLNADDAAPIIADLDARFAASRARGDRVHLREEARYRLEIANDPAGALELARANWQVQKEPLDARILLECAIAADQPEAAAEIVHWVRETGLESLAIAALVKKVEGE